MSELSRRGFLGVAAGAAGGAAVTLGGVRVAEAVGDDETALAVTPASSSSAGPGRGFHGVHQIGIVEPAGASVLLAAFRTVAADRSALAETMQRLTRSARTVVDEPTPFATSRIAPAVDTGVLGAGVRTGLMVTVAVGASLFDDRYGLELSKPTALVPMPYLANDRLDPDRTHGDLLVVLQGAHPDVVQYGLRQLMRATRAGLLLHWTVLGWTRPDTVLTPGRTDNRNLMGFKDGTANPDGADAALMRELVWVGSGDSEPAWASGGTYQAVRTIRMFVEQWDRTPLFEQEAIIGRHKESGAPLGLRREIDDPAHTEDPRGRRMPMDAHIRLANPRTPEAMRARLLRRGFSYSRGFDGAGQLDQGLAFVSYQKRLAQFLDVQERLKGEPLEEYTQVEGGGFFFVLPGVRDRHDWLGRELLAV